MTLLAKILECLETSPCILASMLDTIPRALRKAQRLPGRWTIHEHACHVCIGEKYAFHTRFQDFLAKDSPEFKPISGKDFEDDFYVQMHIEDAFSEFKVLRNKTTDMIASKISDNAFWKKKAKHPEYTLYTPFIMARHLLMHDYFHFYRIEELWLTRDGMFET